ncbi:MAG TPA: EamA family transporter, partial [Thermoanaerobaculia bacterium]|nr:EamA family transporter [Thermoanaerobaculia bacterium]
ALAALILIWGTTWAAIRVGLTGIPPLTGIALRFGLAAVALLALVPVFKVRLGTTPAERRLWVANALLTFCLCYGIVYWAEQWVPSGLMAVLFATYPLWVALLAHFAIPGERLRPVAVAGVLTGFAGVAVIFSEDLRALGGPGIALAAAVALLAPVSAAFASVAVKKWGSEVHPLSISAVPMGLTALIVGPLAAVFDADRGVTFNRASVLALLYLSLFGSALTFTLYFWLLKRLPVSQLALFNYVTPIIAVLTGSLLLDETLTLRILLGSALVVGGVALAVRMRPKTG